MTVVEYEGLPRHATSTQTTEYQRVCCFIRGYRLPLCMSTQFLVIVDKSFDKVSDHSQLMKDIYHESQGRDKGCEIKVDLVGCIFAHDSQEVVLRVDTLRANYFII